MPKIVTMDSIVSKVFVLMDACWIKIALQVTHVSMDNVLIHAKELLIVVIMLFAKLPTIDQSVFVQLDTKDLQLDMDVSKPDVELIQIALQINGVTKENVKIRVPILEHVAKMLNVAFCITKLCVLVQLVLLVIQEQNVCLMSTNAHPILVDHIPDALI